MKTMVLGITLAIMAGSAQADEFVAAFGGSDISMESVRKSGVAELSYRFGDARDGATPELALTGFDADYVFGGVGGNVRTDLGKGWFVDTSGQLGAMIETQGDADPALRVSVGIGRDFSHATSISLGLSRIVTENARFDAATLRLHLKM